MATIEKVIFNKDWRTFKQGEIFQFNPKINILVGDQGCGKSSLLKLITDYSINKHINVEQTVQILLLDDLVSSKVYFYDSEHMNPRTKGRVDTKADVAAIMSSHGQVQNIVLELTKDLRNTIILIDEPETSLSIKSVIILIDLLKNLSKNNQVIVSTHHPLIIYHFNNVLSLEHKSWLSSEDFFNFHFVNKINITMRGV